MAAVIAEGMFDLMAEFVEIILREIMCRICSVDYDLFLIKRTKITLKI